MVTERTGVVHSVPLAPHHLQKVIEGGLVVVEDKNVLSSIDKLLNRVFIPRSQLGIFIRIDLVCKNYIFLLFKGAAYNVHYAQKWKNSSQLSLEPTG